MIHLDGPHLVDEHGRTLLLRGVNLGGSSKLPLSGDSFVGRPFPLADADEHFERLKSWGLTTLRLLTTWEAVEHAGPGRYDMGYLDYLEALTARAHALGFDVFLDFHQDCWSRFSGGDGAPRWTLEDAGFVVEHLHETGAAFLESQHDGPLPRMIWPTNLGKLASATMFTLFFGGDTFAPKTKLQRHLQDHFFGAVKQVLQRVGKYVFAVDLLNEPSPGYIGNTNLEQPFAPVEVGAMPSPLESFRLGMGESLDINVYRRGWLGPRVVKKQRLNPHAKKAWRDRCVWLDHGVWSPDGRLEQPNHFAGDFANDFYAPFLRAAQKHLDGKALCIETEPFHEGPSWSGPGIWAPHWYDGFALFFQDHRSWLAADAFTQKPVFGRSRIRKSFAAQLGRLAAAAEQRNLPLIVGELGVPGHLPPAAMDRTLTAVEDARVSATLWNYTADHTAAKGDGWNGEDFSIFSREAPRPIDAVARPYPRAIAGRLVRYGFDLKTRRFELELDAADGVTDIFVPPHHYASGIEVTADGATTYEPPWLRWRASGHAILNLCSVTRR
ncbi:MAG: cellulase family glycosylhydrolase [Myxococcaceae bacterium]|nr:cellulase family glycosylhydrolase [Myxococcaceae bacterium]